MEIFQCKNIQNFVSQKLLKFFSPYLYNHNENAESANKRETRDMLKDWRCTDREKKNMQNDEINIQEKEKKKKEEKIQNVNLIKSSEEEEEGNIFFGKKAEEFFIEKIPSKKNATNGNFTYPPFMEGWTQERKDEYRKDVLYYMEKTYQKANLKKEYLRFDDIQHFLKNQLNLTDEQMQLTWKQGEEFAKSLMGEKKEENKKRGFFKLNLPHTESNEMEEKEKKDEKYKMQFDEQIDTFDEEKKKESSEQKKKFDPFAGPGDISSAQFIDPKYFKDENLYENLSEEQKNATRAEWKKQEIRLDILISELSSADETLFKTICEPYKDLLLSEKYISLMKLRLMKTPPKTKKDASVLEKLNKHVASLYKQYEHLVIENEKTQLKKIKLICQQAVLDPSKLNQFTESMKPLLDADFVSYLQYAIHTEQKRILNTGMNPDAAPSPWLLILKIIQKGVYATLEHDIWEDILWIGHIVITRYPEVRRTMLELMIASMPKCDWKKFKGIIRILHKAIIQNEDVEFVWYPWIREAIKQLGRDVEVLLPDWLIAGLMDEHDVKVMQIINDRSSFVWREAEFHLPSSTSSPCISFSPSSSSSSQPPSLSDFPPPPYASPSSSSSSSGLSSGFQGGADASFSSAKNQTDLSEFIITEKFKEFFQSLKNKL